MDVSKPNPADPSNSRILCKFSNSNPSALDGLIFQVCSSYSILAFLLLSVHFSHFCWGIVLLLFIGGSPQVLKTRNAPAFQHDNSSWIKWYSNSRDPRDELHARAEEYHVEVEDWVHHKWFVGGGNGPGFIFPAIVLSLSFQVSSQAFVVSPIVWDRLLHVKTLGKEKLLKSHVRYSPV